MNKSQTANSHCTDSITLDDMNGWQLQQVMPTDRHYILFHKEEGSDYVMADAVMLFTRMVDGGMQIKSIGLNYSMANHYDEYWLDETEREIIYDNLNMETLENMIRYIMHIEVCSREEAIAAIKSDFERTKVNIEHEVRKLFKTVE